MIFILDLGDKNRLFARTCPIFWRFLAQNNTLLCASKNGNAKGVIYDAIVGSVGLGQGLCQTNEFQKCF